MIDPRIILRSLVFAVVVAGCQPGVPTPGNDSLSGISNAPGDSTGTPAPAPATGATTQVSDPTGVEWRLVELDGKPAPMGAGNKPATLLLNAADKRASGFAGCNRFSGAYELDAGVFKFGPLMMTKMACDGGGTELETSYANVLGAVRAFALNGDTLSLIAGEKVVARLAR